MYDYQDEVKSQLRSYYFRLAVCFVTPIYLLLNVLDWFVFPEYGLEFLFVRLSMIPIVTFGYWIYRQKWEGLWPYAVIWFSLFIASVQLTYMAWRTGYVSSSVYIYSVNLMAGSLLIFPMSFLRNLITILAIYLPPLALLVPYYLNAGIVQKDLPIIFLSLGTIILFLFAAMGIERIRHQAHGQKMNLFFLATTDMLSGLKLRRYFFNRFIQELSLCLRRGKDLCMSTIIIDIDNFKNVNDQYGHDAGDRCIKHVAEIIRNNTRVYDTACRFGGDEFVVLLPETSLEGAVIVGDRIRQTVQMLPCEFGAKEIGLSVSVGISGYETKLPEELTQERIYKDTKLMVIRNMLELIKKADEALYRSKQQGKNQLTIEEHNTFYTEVSPQDMLSLKSYLIYFDKEMFSLQPQEMEDEITHLEEEEVNFYPQEFFFRRCVESLNRWCRNPEWCETLGIIRVSEGKPSTIRKTLSQVFRATDVLCELEPGLYGVVFFGMEKQALGAVMGRVEKRLLEALE